ncbi:alpha/beta hydrolase [Leifsonia aquatica]|uniref:alpha/beta hydrolase n=1 Tax=Leifsonia aquatica TaxID=144185 RepID=UPI003801824F
MTLELGQSPLPEDLIEGDPHALGEQAERWEAQARSVVAAAAEYRKAVPDVWEGAAAEAFSAARERHLARTAAAATAYREAAAALTAHAAEIGAALRIADRAIAEWSRGETATASARRKHDDEKARAASTPFALPVVSIFVDPGVAIRDNAEALLADARATVSTSGGDTARVLRTLTDRAFTGSVFGAAPLPAGLAEVMAHAGEKKLLRDLRRMSGSELEAYAAAHPELLDRLLDLGPGHIAAWWRKLDDATRSRLARSIPRVVGNLDGVDAHTRSEVNERMLTKDIAALDDELKRLRRTRDGLAPGARALFDRLIEKDEKLLAELTAILRAFGGGPEGAPPHQLYAYQPGEHTKVALSTGLIDDAEHVSLIVPGMGTTAGDIWNYGNAAKHLRDQQFAVSGLDISNIAVIAWLDYEPPGPADVRGVLSNDRAEAGADRLGRTLQGLQGVKSWDTQSPQVSVVAHSYGTNVAAVALARPGIGAGNVVMLGSAGVSGGAPVAAALHVPLGQVYASQAVADGWAPLGQVLSGRTDPTGPGYGANVFTSESTTLDGRELNGVTRHGPFGAEDAPSYLDGLSSAQYATAKATMGRGSDLPYEGTPDDRVALKTDSQLRKLSR